MINRHRQAIGKHFVIRQNWLDADSVGKFKKKRRIAVKNGINLGKSKLLGDFMFKVVKVWFVR